MRIMICGDWHGDANHAEYCAIQAREHDAQVIFQLGDFGYWEHVSGGDYYLNTLSVISQTFGLPIAWIDGNHENHVMLREKYTTPNSLGFVEIRPGVKYVPRGTVWEWDGVRFLGLGGAFSIDRNWRRVGTSFWFEETLTPEEVAIAIKNVGEGVDVMFTHDVLTGVDLPFIFAKLGKRLTPSRESDINRDLVREVALAAQPKRLYHGHYHVDYTETVVMPYGELVVQGLHCDGSGPRSWTILDTDSLT